MNGNKFTVEDVARVLAAAAGAPEGIAAGSDITDIAFDVLGYDSLALLEASSRIEREFGVALDDSWIADVDTPRGLIRLVNTAGPVG